MTNARREFFFNLGAATLIAPFASIAQPLSTRVSRVGVLGLGGISQTYIGAFRERLRTLNYVEGRNVRIERRSAEGDFSRLPEMARELVELKMDVILAAGTIGAQAVKEATSVIPIVAVGAGDLVEAGLVANLGRPSGNLTGFIVASADTGGKQVEILKEIVPRAKRVAVLVGGAQVTAFSERQQEAVQATAAKYQLAFTWYAPRTLNELEDALAVIAKSRPDGMIVLSNPFFFNYRSIIAKFVVKAGLPSVYGFREFVDEGGLASYGASVADSWRRGADYVDKILRGTKVADLPVQFPTAYELVINMRSAKALGVTIPKKLRLRADRVVE
jgi:putative ABC transport system substrate-binding protein